MPLPPWDPACYAVFGPAGLHLLANLTRRQQLELQAYLWRIVLWQVFGDDIRNASYPFVNYNVCSEDQDRSEIRGLLECYGGYFEGGPDVYDLERVKRECANSPLHLMRDDEIMEEMAVGRRLFWSCLNPKLFPHP